MTGRGPEPGAGARYVAVLVFAGAMAWLEAVVVVYLRHILGIGRTETIPPFDESIRRIRSLPWLLSTEHGREVATMVMLLAVGFLAARTWRARFGAWLVCFGAWDIAYYASLYALLRWPPGLFTLDLLFLIPPHPWWYQPVALPVAISCVMIAVGSRLFFRPAGPLPAA